LLWLTYRLTYLSTYLKWHTCTYLSLKGWHHKNMKILHEKQVDTWLPPPSYLLTNLLHIDLSQPTWPPLPTYYCFLYRLTRNEIYELQEKLDASVKRMWVLQMPCRPWLKLYFLALNHTIKLTLTCMYCNRCSKDLYLGYIQKLWNSKQG